MIIDQYKFGGGIPRNGLVGEWLFSGDADDTSGFGNNGVVFGANAINGINNQPNEALSFNDPIPANERVEIDFAELIGLGAFSICFWAKFPSYGGNGNPAAISLNNAGGDTSDLIIIYPSYSGFARVWYSGTLVTVMNEAISLDVWHLFCFVAYSKDDHILNVDNFTYSVQTLNSNRPAITPNMTELKFGTWSPGNQQYTGGLDNIRIYNRVITDEEIGILYAEKTV